MSSWKKNLCYNLIGDEYTNLAHFFSLQSFCAGYTCFWPNGGGLKESNPFSSHPKQSWDDGDDEDQDEDGYEEDE